MPFRIRSVLVASDLTETAREVLRAAAALAALTEAELHVVHAADAGAGRAADEPAQRLREHGQDAIPAAVQLTSARIAAGRAHQVILRRAEEVHADLIVMGPHRPRPESRQVLGTTADRLVRTSEVPCLIVHGGLRLPLRRVLVPSDLSDSARRALDLALTWAAALRVPSGGGTRTRLTVLHVLPEPSARAEPSAPDGAEGVERALREEADAAGERTGCASVLEVATEVAAGESAADEILRRARGGEADLLVMGTHGESALARTLIGSVSSAVARRAGCPVLLVPPGFWKTRQAREDGLRQGG